MKIFSWLELASMNGPDPSSSNADFFQSFLTSCLPKLNCLAYFPIISCPTRHFDLGSSQDAAERERARIRREEEDAKRREAQNRDRAQAIAQQRQAERQRAEEADRKKMEALARAQHRDATQDEEERHSRSERLRRERQEVRVCA